MREATKGPWHVVIDPERIGENWMVATNGDYVIETDGLKADECGDSLADAYLIAAAPDLLTALQLLSSAVSMAGTPMHEQADMRVVAKVVVAALRKATGDSAAEGQA